MVRLWPRRCQARLPFGAPPPPPSFPPFSSFLILYVRAHSGPTFIHMYTSIYMHIDPPRTVYYTLLSPSRTPLDSFAFNLVGVRAFLDAFPPWRATYIFVFVCPTPTHRTSVCRVHL